MKKNNNHTANPTPLRRRGWARFPLFLLTALCLTACQQEDDIIQPNKTTPIPEGMGRVNVTIKAKRPAPATRTETGNWLDPVGDNELINYYWVVFVDGSNTVSEVVGKNWVGENHNVTTTGDTRPQGQDARKPAERDEFSFDVAPGQYTVYGFANITDAEWTALGITKGAPLPDLSQKTLTITNGWDKIIPMTSNIKGQTVNVVAGDNQSFAVEVVRAVAKLQFDFTNDSGQQMDIVGIELFPLTKDVVSLMENETADDIATKRDTIAYRINLASKPIVLAAKSGETSGKGTFTVYVNETNATASGVQNQYSIRLKVNRHLNTEVTTEEYRYGITVNRTEGGFTHICRNDWIKIPISFGDWSFRIEALQFVPIAGYQTTVVSADGLSATFLTGGNICIRPMVRRNTDPEGVWSNIGVAGVAFNPATDENGNMAFTAEGEEKTCPITGKKFHPCYKAIGADGTGIVLTGDCNILTMNDQSHLFELLESGDIVGQLENEDTMEGKLTFTIYISLEGRLYSFSYNIIKANKNQD